MTFDINAISKATAEHYVWARAVMAGTW